MADINHIHSTTAMLDESEAAESYRRSLVEAAALKQRLKYLMGTNEVRTSDPLYADTLRERLWQEYEAKLDRKEAERAESERARMRRLLKDGIISLEELKEDPLFMKEYKKQKAKYGRANPQRPKSPSRRHRAQTAPPCSTEPRIHRQNPQQHNLLDTRPSHFPAPSSSGYGNGRPHTAASARRDRPKTVQWERRKNVKPTNETEEDEEFDGKLRPHFLYKYEDPQVKKLREVESVDDLYSLAEEILDGKLPSQKNQASAPKKSMVVGGL